MLSPRKCVFILVLAILSSIVANIPSSHCSVVTITYADTLTLEFDISINMAKAGVIEDNNTRLFVLSEAWIGDFVFGDWINVSPSQVQGTSALLKTKYQDVAYTYGESLGAVQLFNGVEFDLENVPPSEVNSTVSFHVGLRVRDNYGLFLRLNREYPDYYPFDALTFGLSILIFSKGAYNESVTIDFSEDFFTSSAIPLVPTSRSIGYGLKEWGFLLSSEGQVEDNVVTQFSTDDIVLVRNDFEHTFVPMLLIVSFLLVIIVALLTWKTRLDGVIAVFLSLVVLDIGIFEKLRQVGYRNWVPNMLAVLDLFCAASLVLIVALLVPRRVAQLPVGQTKKGYVTEPFTTRVFIAVLVIIPIGLRLFSGSLFCNQFWYFSFGLRVMYISIGLFMLLVPVLVCIFFITGRALYHKRNSFKIAMTRLARASWRKMLKRKRKVQKTEDRVS